MTTSRRSLLSVLASLPFLGFLKPGDGSVKVQVELHDECPCCGRRHGKVPVKEAPIAVLPVATLYGGPGDSTWIALWSEIKQRWIVVATSVRPGEPPTVVPFDLTADDGRLVTREELAEYVVIKHEEQVSTAPFSGYVLHRTKTLLRKITTSPQKT